MDYLILFVIVALLCVVDVVIIAKFMTPNFKVVIDNKLVINKKFVVLYGIFVHIVVFLALAYMTHLGRLPRISELLFG
ncbi:hypothetical protein [Staphylospora marina]|uniref:hypothetical protein n=1 Tax=Staphylospora marina TaxID=2490858 RepID=UPI000F5C00B4|nr:hypothetical protein [Staphylospora marina]